MCDSRVMIEGSFDAVYYTRASPPPPDKLAVLGLVFDKIFFPGVRVPTGIDRQAAIAEISRLKALQDSEEVDNATQINLLITALQLKEFERFCVFTGNSEGSAVPSLEQGAQDLAAEVESLYWGPPEPGFTPAITSGYVYGAPGRTWHPLAFPGIWTYTANAVLYSRKHGKVLVNTDPTLPVPGGPAVDHKRNATALSLIIAIEAVKFVLPRLRPMEPTAIADFRDEVAPYVRPFRLAMLRLSKELDAMLQGTESLDEVQKCARFLVETTVYPQLHELTQVLHEPVRPWYRRAVDLAREAPELVSAFTSMPLSLAVAKLLAKLASTLADYRDDQVTAKKRHHTGLYYLLRVQELGK